MWFEAKQRRDGFAVIRITVFAVANANIRGIRIKDDVTDNRWRCVCSITNTWLIRLIFLKVNRGRGKRRHK